VPLLQEHYWLVCLKSALDTPAVQQLLSLLQAADWSAQLGALAGYAAESETGQVQSLKRTLPWW
jgi:putative molybdopterin biosynthesis protein